MITITPGGKGSGYARRDVHVILVCLDCPHTERANKFDERLGSRRTQAAGAMLKHVRNEHGKESIRSTKTRAARYRSNAVSSAPQLSGKDEHEFSEA